MDAGQFKRLFRGIADPEKVLVGWAIDDKTIYTREIGQIKVTPSGIILVGSEKLVSFPGANFIPYDFSGKKH